MKEQSKKCFLFTEQQEEQLGEEIYENMNRGASPAEQEDNQIPEKKEQQKIYETI